MPNVAQTSRMLRAPSQGYVSTISATIPNRVGGIPSQGSHDHVYCRTRLPADVVSLLSCPNRSREESARRSCGRHKIEGLRHKTVEEAILNSQPAERSGGEGGIHGRVDSKGPSIPTPNSYSSRWAVLHHQTVAAGSRTIAHHGEEVNRPNNQKVHSEELQTVSVSSSVRGPE